MPAAPATPGGTATRVARRPARIGRNLLISLFAVLALWGVLANSGGTYAFWSTEATVDGGVISTGTAALSADWTEAQEEPLWQNLLPGETAGRSLTVTNTGDVPMALAASSTSATHSTSTTSGIALHVAEGECRAGGTGSPALDGTFRNIPSLRDQARSVTVDPGKAVTLCVAVAATETLTPSAEIDIVLALEGRQIV